MAKNIETEFEVGDWMKCFEGEGLPFYTNITKENVSKYNNSDLIKKYSLEKVSGKGEIREAEKYFIGAVSLRKGDYLKFKNGKDKVVDRIVFIPEIEGDLLSIDSYIYNKSNGWIEIGTETGHRIRYFNAVENKISEEDAKEFLVGQIKELEKDLKKFENQSKELAVRKFF